MLAGPDAESGDFFEDFRRALGELAQTQSGIDEAVQAHLAGEAEAPRCARGAALSLVRHRPQALQLVRISACLTVRRFMGDWLKALCDELRDDRRALLSVDDLSLCSNRYERAHAYLTRVMRLAPDEHAFTELGWLWTFCDLLEHDAANIDADHPVITRLRARPNLVTFHGERLVLQWALVEHFHERLWRYFESVAEADAGASRFREGRRR